MEEILDRAYDYFLNSTRYITSSGFNLGRQAAEIIMRTYWDDGIPAYISAKRCIASRAKYYGSPESEARKLWQKIYLKFIELTREIH